MSRRRGRSWWDGITPGGFMVTFTACAVTIAFATATVRLYWTDRLDAAAATGSLALSCLATTVALQARNRPDPAATVEQPATVTAVPDDPPD